VRIFLLENNLNKVALHFIAFYGNEVSSLDIKTIVIYVLTFKLKK